MGTGAMHCAYCGRPAAALVWLGGFGYHEECTRGPAWRPQTYEPVPSWPGTTPMTDARVREIVRDELQRLGLFNNPNA